MSCHTNNYQTDHLFVSQYMYSNLNHSTRISFQYKSNHFMIGLGHIVPGFWPCLVWLTCLYSPNKISLRINPSSTQLKAINYHKASILADARIIVRHFWHDHWQKRSTLIRVNIQHNKVMRWAFCQEINELPRLGLNIFHHGVDASWHYFCTRSIFH